MRVLLLNQTFWPDVAATAQHGWDLAETLAREGYEVVAIASRSIYGQKGAALPRREIHNGVEIHRVGASLFGRADGGVVGRVIDFGLWYILAAAKALSMRRCDVCVAFTTPPFIALIGLLLRALRGTKLVYWAMDLYPDTPVLYGMLRPQAPLTRVLERIHRAILKKSDHVIVLGRCMERRVLDKGTPRERVSVVRVWADGREVIASDPQASAYRREWGLESKFVVMYSGNFGLMHDATTFVDAATALRDREDIVWLFVGGGSRRAEVEAAARERGLTNVRLEPYQPRERLNELLTMADVHLISMIEGAEGLIVPCKLFGILAAGRPAIFVGPRESEIARVIEESKCGHVFAVGDSRGLAGAISDYAAARATADRDGAAGRRALECEYDRSIACRAIKDILLAVTGERRTTKAGATSVLNDSPGEFGNDAGRVADNDGFAAGAAAASASSRQR